MSLQTRTVHCTQERSTLRFPLEERTAFCLALSTIPDDTLHLGFGVWGVWGRGELFFCLFVGFFNLLFCFVFVFLGFFSSVAVSVKDFRELTSATSRLHELRLPGSTGNSILYLTLI